MQVVVKNSWRIAGTLACILRRGGGLEGLIIFVMKEK